MDVGFRTDKGRRRFNNEDAFFVMKNDRVFVVADGVGGNNSGEIASRTATKQIADFVKENDIDSMDPVDFLLKAIEKANAKVYDLSKKYKENNGMATTTVIAYLKGSWLYILNVGDSRAYIYEQGYLRQLTEDHTYVNTLVKLGIITKEEAEVHDERYKITKAVGAEADIEPDISRIKISRGDKIILCSDGLSGELGDEGMEEILAKEESMTETCRLLVDAANEHGGNDNITVICIEFTEEDFDE